MNLKEFAEKINDLVQKCPDAEVRMEVFGNLYDAKSQINAPQSFILNEKSKKLTILGDGKLLKY